MAETPLHLSPVYILLRAAVSEGFDPCETLRELLSQLDDKLDKNPQDGGAHPRKQEAQMLLAEFCNDSAEGEDV